MPDFTQGKWEVATDGCIGIYDGDYWLDDIAEVCDYNSCDEAEARMAKANARLIAAAPDMYRILCYFGTLFLNYEHIDDIDPDIEDDIYKILKAIDGKED